MQKMHGPDGPYNININTEIYGLYGLYLNFTPEVVDRMVHIGLAFKNIMNGMVGIGAVIQKTWTVRSTYRSRLQKL